MCGYKGDVKNRQHIMFQMKVQLEMYLYVCRHVFDSRYSLSIAA